MDNDKGSSVFHHHQPPSSSSFSSTLDDNNNRSSKSLRLQTTLAELEWKIEKILEVVEDNGDTFAERAQMYYQKRPELIQMLGDLRKSYRALADKVVTIRSDSIPAPTNYRCCSSTRDNYNHHSDRHLMIFDHKHSRPQNDDDLTASHKSLDYDNCHRRELMLFTEQQHNNSYPDDIVIINTTATATAEEKVISSVFNPCDGVREGGDWDELLAQVTELMEENASKQADLVRRYAKRNEDMKLLIKENRRLRELLSDTNNQTSSQARWKPRHFFKKLLP